MAAKVFHYRRTLPARLLMAAAVVLLGMCVWLVPLLARRGSDGVTAIVALVVLTVAIGGAAIWRSDDLGATWEYRTRRRFRAVCREKRLTSTEGSRVVYPALTQLVGGGGVLTARIRPLYGQSMADWEKAAPAFALAYAVAAVRFRDNGDGTLMMAAGYQALDAHTAVVDDVDQGGDVDWSARLATVSVGTAEGGRRYSLPFLGTHVLVAGITGAGKGSAIWSIVLGLLPAYRAGVVRFWGIDPKRLELAMGRDFFGDRYANSDVEAVELLERAAAEMLERAESLAGHARKVEPSELHPVNVLFVDELGYLSALLPDRKLRDRADKALSAILVLGRSVGWIVVGAVQDPRKETLSFRDLFPTCVAMKLPKPMVDLVLGTGMHAAGAVCEQIPPPAAGGAGVAFVVSENSGVPVCVRFSWCSDELIKTTAVQLAPLAMRPRLAAN